LKDVGCKGLLFISGIERSKMGLRGDEDCEGLRGGGGGDLVGFGIDFDILTGLEADVDLCSNTPFSCRKWINSTFLKREYPFNPCSLAIDFNFITV
jgi:hypothetical protein